MRFKDPRNEMMFCGVGLSLVGLVITIIFNEINLYGLLFNMFGSLFIATSLVFRMSFIINYFKQQTGKRR